MAEDDPPRVPPTIRKRGGATLAQLIAARRLARDRQREQTDQAIEWLRRQWGEHRACPYCEANRWEVGPMVAAPVLGEDTEIPMFPVICANCGQTTLVNAIKAGVVEADTTVPPFQESPPPDS